LIAEATCGASCWMAGVNPWLRQAATTSALRPWPDFRENRMKRSSRSSTSAMLVRHANA